MAKIVGQTGEWRRVPGEYIYTDKNGNEAVGRGEHMENVLSGVNLTIRQFQNQQKAALAAAAPPNAPPRAPRQARRATMGGPYYQRLYSVEKQLASQRRRGFSSVYSRHGGIISLYFHDLNEAYLWFLNEYVHGSEFLQQYSIWIIMVRYQSRNDIRFGGSDQGGYVAHKGKFAVLSPEYRRSTELALSDEVWVEAGNRLDQGFTLDSSSAIILYGTEY